MLGAPLHIPKLPDCGLTPPEVAVSPAPTCHGRGNLDADSPEPKPTTHATAVRVPFPHATNHAEEITNWLFLHDAGLL